MARHEGLRVDLYLRERATPAVAEQQRHVRSRLEGGLGSAALSVREHPRRIPADDDGPLRDRYASVREWASETGVSLSPFFERREAYDPGAGTVREMVTLPVLWLTVSDGAALRATYPHVDDEVETVSHAVSELLEGSLPEAAD